MMCWTSLQERQGLKKEQISESFSISGGGGDAFQQYNRLFRDSL